MRFLSTSTHGFLDYATGAFLIVAPLLFGFANGGTPMLVSMTAGVFVIGMSLATDYERGMVPWVPMPVHLGADFALGMLLLTTPLAFEFPARAWLPLFAVGLLSIAASSVTHMISSHPHRLRAAAPRRMP